MTGLVVKQSRDHKLTLCLDNQAAIRALMNVKPHPSHYSVDEFHERLKHLQSTDPRLVVKVQWVPGHRNTPGNEESDICATSRDRPLPPFQILLEAGRKALQAENEYPNATAHEPTFP